MSATFSVCGRAVVVGIAVIAVFAAGPAPLSGQDRDSPGSSDRRAEAARLEGSLTIDGRLAEAEWKRAEVITGFTQVEPDEGEAATERTEVRLLYDDENIYIAARMFESDTSEIARQLTRRDNTGRAAGYFEFSFDSNFDRTTGYTFRVTAAGVQRDEYMFDDTEDQRSWNGVWESAVSIDGEGWVAEIRLPLSQVRYAPSSDPQVWGVNFARRRIADNERVEWAWVPQGTSGEVSRWGRLEGLVLSEQRQYAEILPYLMTSLEQAPAEPGNPFFDGTALDGRVGADLRYGIGSTFVLDAAINPDFGQVEVDPRVINLSAFETFFPERRPFFTRDDQLFDFSLSGGSNNLFYSRRIGRQPQGSAPDGADFVDVPSETNILGAAKVTGRTEGGLNVGGLLALTGREQGRAYDADGDERRTFPVEPRTLYGTGRVEQKLRDGQSTVGGMVTAVERSMSGDTRLDFLTDEAFSAGLDFEHTWSDREWALWGFAAGSMVQGSQRSILRIKQSPNHYFQRPDQDYLDLDSTATALTGAEWRLQFERRSGRHWTGDVWLSQRTPGFEVNDIGFSTATENIGAGGRVTYREYETGDVFRDYDITLSGFQRWRHSVADELLSTSAWGEARKDGNVKLEAGFTFLNWWGVEAGIEYTPAVRSDVLTRGGPLMVDPGNIEYSVGASTDRRDAVTLDASASYEDGGRGGHEFSVDVGVDARPTNGLVLGLEPQYEKGLDLRQYVAEVPDEDFAPTYGARYFFSDLRREELSVETRINLIFSPTLSLEVFAQPLVAAGDVRRYKQLARSGSFDFRRFPEGRAVAGEGGQVSCEGGALCTRDGRVYVDYSGDGAPDASFGEQDFNARSLRGNAVLRWEYRPGSRIFLVWQQRRSSPASLGRLDLGRDAGAIFDSPGEHVFMIKVDHWIDL